MNDTELVLKKLAFIETCVEELRRLARPECIETDIREERFIAHTLQLAIQAALDVASHIVSEQRLGEPGTNRELFALLQKAVMLSPELVRNLERMAGFRNILVHGYQKLDLSVLRHAVLHNLPDLLAYANAVRQQLPGE